MYGAFVENVCILCARISTSFFPLGGRGRGAKIFNQSLSSLISPHQLLFSEVITKLMLVSQATKAISKKKCKAEDMATNHNISKQIKLGMVLHVHYVETDLLSLADIGNEFLSCNNSRMHIFGQFKKLLISNIELHIWTIFDPINLKNSVWVEICGGMKQPPHCLHL